MGMQEQAAETAMNEESSGLSRRGLFVSGGLLAAGLGAFGAEGIASAASTATTTKIAVVTHGDTGSFWSVFKAGVDQATKDMKAPRRERHAGLRQQRRLQAGLGHQRGDRVQGQRDRDLRAGRERAQGSAHEGVRQGHRDHHGQLGRGRLRLAQDVRGARRAERGDRGRGRRQAVQRRRGEVGGRRDPRGQQLGPDRSRQGRQGDVQGHHEDAPDPEREGRHPRHAGQDQGLLRRQQGHGCAARARPGRHGSGPGRRAEPARRSGRSTSTRP